MSGADDGTAESYCLCGSADDGRLMLECSANAAGCGGWVHPDCFDMTPSQVAAAEASDQWVCPLCCGDVKDEAAARTRARAVTEQYRASNSNVAPLSTSAAGDVDQPEDDFDEPDDMDDDDDSEDGAPKKRARGRGAGRGRKPAEGTTSKRGGSVSRRGRKPKSAMVRHAAFSISLLLVPCLSWME
jgi:PHD-finger